MILRKILVNVFGLIRVWKECLRDLSLSIQAFVDCSWVTRRHAIATTRAISHTHMHNLEVAIKESCPPKPLHLTPPPTRLFRTFYLGAWTTTQAVSEPWTESQGLVEGHFLCRPSWARRRPSPCFLIALFRSSFRILLLLPWSSERLKPTSYNWCTLPFWATRFLLIITGSTWPALA